VRVTIGLIAGHGNFPREVLGAARQSGHDVAVVAIAGEATPDFEGYARNQGVSTFSWIELGQLGACIQAFKGAGVSQATMAGRVRHVRIFGGIAPDPLLLAVLQKLPTQNADALLSAVVAVLGDHGISVTDSIALLPELVAPAGLLTQRAPDDAMQADFAFGYRIADVIAGADIGQTVIVKDRAVVAVEGMEGTDAAIERAGALAGQGVRVVKVAKPAQDRRFDVPVVGLGTLTAMKAAGADALSIDAGLTLVVDGDRFYAAANDAGLVVFGRQR
jgi:UDP-2,3-diacylglucosamine hydrolase